jgi:hypothetical protein
VLANRPPWPNGYRCAAAITFEVDSESAQVYRVSSEEEAVRLANDTPFGLGSYL